MAVKNEKEIKLSEFEQKLISEVFKAAYERLLENGYSSTVPKTCKGYEMLAGPKNAITNMTLTLPSHYTDQPAQNYKRKPENPNNAGFA